jgi:hypothetical protein
MIKPNRPSEENGVNSGPNVSNPKLGKTSDLRFNSADEFSNWIEDQLDHLEALYADFSSKDSLRGYFSR